MKKLIAMIGAVAMSFGLFAADAYSISFETVESEKGVDTTSMLFTPPVSAAEWAWTTDEALPLKAYGTETKFEYGTGAYARRDGKFAGMTDNANYLPLSTGNDELTRAVNGNLYLDQLVKFTGFEDPQTNLVAGTKIAVWMSEFENDDESTETNLYVTVGKVDANNVAEQVALKIDGTYSLDTWYRISIKSLGDIYKGAEFTTPRAAFLVYVNGKQVTVAEEDMKVATALITNEGSMDGIARDYMAKGQLFTSIAADATFTSVGYQGIGAVDDIIVDAEGPDFCVETETVNVTFADITGAVITKVVDSDGTVFTDFTSAISVKPGELTVTLAAAKGYKMTSSGEYIVDVSAAGQLTVTVAKGDFVEVYATKNGTVEYGADELYGMITSLVDGDVVLFNLASTINDGSDDLYSFSENATINVTGDNGAITWNVAVSNVNAAAGTYEDYVGVAAGNTLNVWFETDEDAFVSMYADVAGTLNVEVATFSAGSNIRVSGTITAASMEDNSDVTLEGAGKVITQVSNLKSILDGDGNAVTPTAGVPEEDWYTYALSDVPPEKIEYVTFTVTYDTAKVENVTVKTNGADVVNVEGVYTVESNAVVTVAATAKTGYQNVTIAVDNVTVDAGVFKADKASSVITIAAFTLQPVDPETPKNYDSKEAADAAAAKINASRETLIKTPEGAVAKDYTDLFTAVVTANNAVVVELNEGGTNALKTAADTIKTAVANKLGDIAAAAAGGNVEVVVTGVEPGFWYGVAATADLTTMGASQPGEWKQATTEGVTLKVTKPATGNAAFFQTRVKVK